MPDTWRPVAGVPQAHAMCVAHVPLLRWPCRPGAGGLPANLARGGGGPGSGGWRSMGRIRSSWGGAGGQRRGAGGGGIRRSSRGGSSRRSRGSRRSSSRGSSRGSSWRAGGGGEGGGGRGAAAPLQRRPHLLHRAAPNRCGAVASCQGCSHLHQDLHMPHCPAPAPRPPAPRHASQCLAERRQQQAAAHTNTPTLCPHPPPGVQRMLRDLPPSSFKRLLLKPSMIDDHSLSSYQAGLRTLVYQISSAPQ